MNSPSTLQVGFQVGHIFGPAINNLSHVSPSSSVPITQAITVSEQTKSRYIYHGELFSSQTSTRKSVTLKFATSFEEMELLEKEYSLYARDLNHLQGCIIPRCFGLYYGHDSRERVMCLVLERCIPKPIHPNQLRQHEAQFYRELLDGLCQIHASGIFHNALYTGNHIMRHGYSPRIIDFSAADMHVCDGYPPLESHGGSNGACCSELVAFNLAYLKKSRGSFAPGQTSADPGVVSSLDHAFYGY